MIQPAIADFSISGFRNLFICIEVWLIYNIVLISDVQQSDSAIHTYVYFFQILLPLLVITKY